MFNHLNFTVSFTMNILLTPQNVHPVLLVDSFATTQVSFLITFAHSFLWSQQNFIAPSYRATQISACYRRHEREKRRAYEQCVLEIEQGSFTPLVFSTSGGMGSGATVAYKCLASLLYQERVTLQYSDELASLPPILFTSSLCCHGSQRLTLKTWLRAT